jgi:hypothetical protein
MAGADGTNAGATKKTAGNEAEGEKINARAANCVFLLKKDFLLTYSAVNLRNYGILI